MRISIDKQRCKGCGLCVAFCPSGLISISVELNSRGYHPAVIDDESKCRGCQNCALICPDLAITIEQ
ncbi:MAG: 4Fe-4S binding protein [Candidatus Latescibacteria bacterium]|nr:4Fe-4S binding protein [Candidatus Latescibacterota bacterium]